MASIIKRKNSYCVVYRYTDEKGKSHQRWESFPTNAEARKRKNQIEYEQDNNVFTVPKQEQSENCLWIIWKSTA